MPVATKAVQKHSRAGSPLEVLLAFGKLGVTCFWTPIAHIGYFREEFVVQRRWLDEHAYADLVALCQFLPGPASTQVGFSIGLMRSGYSEGLQHGSGSRFRQPSCSSSLPLARPHYRGRLGSLPARAMAQAAMRGVNAAVVGLLGAALYNPVWTSAVKTAGDFWLALVGFVLLVAWHAPPLVVVAISALGGIALALGAA
jgi:chromate transporter